MKELSVEGSSILIYNDIKELPVIRYREFQKFSILENEAGDNKKSLDNRLSNIETLIVSNRLKDALQEARNARLAILYINESIDFQLMSLVCLIHSIDGEKVNDLSEDGVLRVARKLQSIISKGELSDIIVSVKKK